MAGKLQNSYCVLPDNNLAFWQIIEEIDILDFSALEIIFTKYNIDRVIHLAAYPGVYFSSVHPELYIKNNIEGTFNIFEISRRQGIKNIVFASSSTVYKGLKPPFEEDCLSISDCFAASSL